MNSPWRGPNIQPTHSTAGHAPQSGTITLWIPLWCPRSVRECRCADSLPPRRPLGTTPNTGERWLRRSDSWRSGPSALNCGSGEANSRMNQDFVDLLRSFIGHDVRFMIVGAYALAGHSRPRATGYIEDME